MEPLRSPHASAGKLGKGGKNLEAIGVKFLCPNCFRVFQKQTEERLPTYIFMVLGNLEIWRQIGNV